MSSVVIAGDTSGAITLAAPAVAGTNTITLPASTGTVVTTGSPQSGSVLQVVSNTYTTIVTTTSTSPVTTNLAVSITPKFSTSKIFAIVNLGGTGIAGNDVAKFYIYRGATLITTFHDNFYHNTSSPLYAPVGMSVLDSPATTSATTYTVYFASGAGSEATMNANSRTNSIITLMEIAA
jgi:hypothetical protein